MKVCRIFFQRNKSDFLESNLLLLSTSSVGLVDTRSPFPCLFGDDREPFFNSLAGIFKFSSLDKLSSLP